eukprot:TRINITY_DN405_c2_g1_i1.p1 TRINITY_DN405_c2_g1~~TRINITY_DN405_c2_g1_i1.p1  ORF type:complete len:162 (+),score=19.68 TRINITY_DN405_c2_g1_i1:57-542(+)
MSQMADVNSYTDENGLITTEINLSFPGDSLKVKFDDVDDGVCLTFVEPSGPVGMAGITSGTNVLGIGGYRVHCAFDFKRALTMTAKAGKKQFFIVHTPGSLVVDPTLSRHEDTLWYRNDMLDKLRVTTIRAHPFSHHSATSSGRQVLSKRDQPKKILLFDR